MKIEHAEKNKMVLFKDVPISDTFRYDNKYFMRLYNIFRDDCGIICVNAVDLQSGEYRVFEDDMLVDLLNATLLIN